MTAGQAGGICSRGGRTMKNETKRGFHIDSEKEADIDKRSAKGIGAETNTKTSAEIGADTDAETSAETDEETETAEETDTESNQKAKKKKSPQRELFEWIVYLAVVAVASILVITFVGQRTIVDGDSMLTTLHDGDNLWVDKLSFHFRDPQRYEIIVFPYQYKQNTYYIKRIIGLPGETVQVKDGYVYIDGEKLDEHYGNEPMSNPGIAAEPIELGEDEYFVLGDNRNHSSDSRDPKVGILKRKDLVGRAWIRIWPLNRLGVIRHE